jgi:Flp pilus assembly protein TadD
VSTFAARLLAIAVAAALAACTPPATTTDHLTAARAHLATSQTESAVIELKRALQLDPESAEIRFLLGRTLLDQGQAADGLIELDRAAALGLPASQVAPSAARALLALGQVRQVVDRYQSAALPAGQPAADLRTSVAAAYAAQGLRDRATAAVEQALRLLPGFPPARLLQVRLLAAAGDTRGSDSLLQSLLGSEPQDADAWQLQGDLLAGRHASATSAAQAYRRSLALRPSGVPAHAGLVAALLRSGDIAGARQQADAMRTARPGDPLTVFAQAQVSFAEGDLAKARALALLAARALPEHPRVLQFLGLTALQLGAPLAAEPPLLKSLQRAPEAALTRHLLAAVYLATGQPGKLEQVLEPLLEHADAEALQQRAQSRLQAGLPGLAPVRLAGPTAPPQPDGSAEAGLRQVEGLIAGRQFDAALKALASLDARHPGQPETAYLRGRLRLAQRDPVAARAAFEQALVRTPAHGPSALALAALDAQAGQTALALARLEALRLSRPQDPAPVLALAALLESSADRSGRAGALLADAVRDHPGDPQLRMATARQLLRAGKAQAAGLVLQDGAAAMSGNADLLDALGRVQLQEHAFGQALLTFNKLLVLRPDSIEPLLRTAEAHVGLGETAPARQALLRALAQRPASLQAQRGLISLALLERQPQAALALARQVQRQPGALGVGLLLEGDVQVSSGNTSGAAAAYLEGLRRAPATEVAAKAHAALLALGRDEAAAALAVDWRRTHPRDADFAVHLGNGALARGDAAAAEREFLEAVRLQPLHGLALNNLAMAMLTLEHGGARVYAERAATLLPDSASVQDTLATARRAEPLPVRVSASPPKPTPAAPR